MRATESLSMENENLIQVFAHNAGKALEIPQSLLWCLMFQESRLDHLSGLNAGKLSTGLGQFSNSAIFELNHQLDNYLHSPSRTLAEMLGFDIRPITSNSQHTSSLNSYYYIPTAVTATALYLNNRKIQLARILDKRGIAYDVELLWGWAAISYNKGTRSVLAIWKQIESKEGIEGLRKAVSEKDVFLRMTLNSVLINKALRSIWSNELHDTYTKELLTHVENLRDCAIPPQNVEKRNRNENRAS